MGFWETLWTGLFILAVHTLPFIAMFYLEKWIMGG